MLGGFVGRWFPCRAEGTDSSEQITMDQAEFDGFAKNYRELHARNIELTGEEPEYFAAYKMRDFAAVLRASRAPEAGRYLDFGSGVGASVPHFKALLPRAALVCADVSVASLEVSRATHGDAATYLSVRNGLLALEDSSIDGAFACCVFHHIPSAAHGAALREILRVLRPGAQLMIYEHNPLNPLTVRAVRTCPLDENAILIGAHEMARRCRQAGFGRVKINFRVFFPAALKALRPLENRLRWLPLGAQYFVQALRG